jgi:hypothetical protein
VCCLLSHDLWVRFWQILRNLADISALLLRRNLTPLPPLLLERPPQYEYEKDIKAYYRKSHGDFPNSLPQTNEATREFFIKHLPQEVRQDVTARYNVKRAAHNQKNKALTASLHTFEKGDGLTPYQRYE